MVCSIIKKREIKKEGGDKNMTMRCDVYQLKDISFFEKTHFHPNGIQNTKVFKKKDEDIVFIFVKEEKSILEGSFMTVLSEFRREGGERYSILADKETHLIDVILWMMEKEWKCKVLFDEYMMQEDDSFLHYMIERRFKEYQEEYFQCLKIKEQKIKEQKIKEVKEKIKEFLQNVLDEFGSLFVSTIVIRFDDFSIRFIPKSMIMYKDFHVFKEKEKDQSIKSVVEQLYHGIFEAIEGKHLEIEEVSLLPLKSYPHDLAKASDFFSLLLQKNGEDVRKKMELTEEEYRNITNKIESFLRQYQHKIVYKK